MLWYTALAHALLKPNVIQLTRAVLRQPWRDALQSLRVASSKTLRIDVVFLGAVATAAAPRWQVVVDLVLEEGPREKLVSSVAQNVALGATRVWQKAKQLLSNFQRVGQADAISFSVTLRPMPWENAWQMLEMSCCRGLRQNVVLSSAPLINSFWKDASLKLRQMERHGPRPDVVAYGSVASTLETVGLLSMQSHALSFNISCLNAAMSIDSLPWSRCLSMFPRHFGDGDLLSFSSAIASLAQGYDWVKALWKVTLIESRVRRLLGSFIRAVHPDLSPEFPTEARRINQRFPTHTTAILANTNASPFASGFPQETEGPRKFEDGPESSHDLPFFRALRTRLGRVVPSRVTPLQLTLPSLPAAAEESDKEMKDALIISDVFNNRFGISEEFAAAHLIRGAQVAMESSSSTFSDRPDVPKLFTQKLQRRFEDEVISRATKGHVLV
eukprot:symbB.v1.2.025591.t1/scaffold2493.1/size77834/4